MTNLAIKALGQIAKKQIPEFKEIVKSAEEKFNNSRKSSLDESERTSCAEQTFGYNSDKIYRTEI